MQTDKPKVLWDKLLILKTPILNISWVFNRCLTCLILLYTWGQASYFVTSFTILLQTSICCVGKFVCGKRNGENKLFGNLGFIVSL